MPNERFAVNPAHAQSMCTRLFFLPPSLVGNPKRELGTRLAVCLLETNCDCFFFCLVVYIEVQSGPYAYVEGGWGGRE